MSLTPEQRNYLTALSRAEPENVHGAILGSAIRAALDLIDQQAEQIRQTEHDLLVLCDGVRTALKHVPPNETAVALRVNLMRYSLWREPGPEGV